MRETTTQARLPAMKDQGTKNGVNNTNLDDLMKSVYDLIARLKKKR